MAANVGGAFAGTERFRILRRIGEGGMGVVYEAHDRERDCPVALKTLRTREPGALLRLKHEFRALRDLTHHNLVSFGELFEAGGNWFFTMELVRGVDLLTWVRAGASDDAGPMHASESASAATVGGIPGKTPSSESSLSTVTIPPTPPASPAPPLDEARLRAALRQLAEGLVALHDANKVHRDIKPSNILVSADSRVVVLDFGLVADVDHGDGDGEVAGTLLFMAPEQTAPGPVGPPADWYAVGVLLYLALTGRPPFVGARDLLFELKRGGMPTPPRVLAPQVPRDLEALCLDLLQPDPAARPDGRAVLQRLGAAASAPARDASRHVKDAPFVGREDELAELRRAFADSRRGRVAVLVHGESGVGKSTLVRHFTDELAAGDAVVLTGRCYERESVPYKAIDEVVDGLSRHLKRLPPIEAATLLPRMASLLTHVFPVLLDVEPFARSPRLQNEVADPQEQRARVFSALRELLARLGDRHPLVLVIDDLQWADADSLALLAEVLRPPLAPTVLLLATVRTTSEPGTAGNTLDAWLRQLGDVRHQWLHNLPPAEARRLVGLLATAEPRLDHEAIASESEGHPLFIDALVRHRLVHGAGATSLRLEEALWARVQALPPEERTILEFVAVAGRPLSQAVVARAAGLDLGVFSEAATHLRRANFVRTDGVRATDAIESYHDRVRAAVRANLDATRLQLAAERLARALEASGSGDPEALSVYWQTAGDAERAAHYAVAAATHAAKALAFDQAARHYRTALELRPIDGAEGHAVRARLAEALALAGRGAEAAAAFRAAAALATGAEQLELTRRGAEQLLLSGHIDDGLSEMGAVLAAAGLKLAPTPRRALASLALHRTRLWLRGTRFRERDVSDLPPRLLELIDLSFSVAQGLMWVDVLRGAEFQTRLIRLTLDAGEPTRLTRALALEAGFAATSGGDGPKRAKALLDTASALADRSGDPLGRAVVLGVAGFSAVARQAYPEAVQLNDEAERLLAERCVGAFWELALVRTNLLFSLSLVGDLHAVRERGARYIRAAQERGDLLAATSMTCGPMYGVALADDEPERAAHDVDTAMSRWSQRGVHLQHLYALSARTQIDLYRGRGADAHQRMVEAWPGLKRAWFLTLVVTRCWMREQRGRTAVSAAREATGADRERLLAEAEKLARRLERERLPAALAHAAGLRGGVASVRGDTAAASAAYGEAVQRFEAAGMAMHRLAARAAHARVTGDAATVAECEAGLAALGIRVPSRMCAALIA